MSKTTFQLALAAFLVTGTLWGAKDPFVGNWKLDPSKSVLTDVMKVKALGENKFELDFGSGTPETVVADGTDQPGSFGTTVSITVIGPRHWKVSGKKDSHALAAGDWTLSEDGNTLNDHLTANRADGSTLTLDYVYKRTAAGSGFAGVWESVSEKVDSVFEYQIEPFDANGLAFINRAQHETQKMKFDGKDYPDAGPNVPAGLVSSGRRVNEHALKLTDKVNGKVLETRQLDVSPDLKTLTMTIQAAGRSKPNILVFIRE
jgi:hypothetical protein